MTELRQALTLALHAEACGCSDFIGIGDEDNQYEKLADAVLRVLAEHGDTEQVRNEIERAIDVHPDVVSTGHVLNEIMGIVAPRFAAFDAVADLAAARQLEQVRALLVKYAKPGRRRGAIAGAVPVDDLFAILDAPAGHDESGQ